MRQYTLTPRLATMQTPINPPALPGSPCQPADPSPHRHSAAKWTATTFIAFTCHSQMLMAPAGKELYLCIYQVILTLIFKCATSNPGGKCDNWPYLHQQVFFVAAVMFFWVFFFF